MSNWVSRNRENGFFLALPTILWISIFFVVPLVIVLIVSFMTRTSGGLPELPSYSWNIMNARSVYSRPLSCRAVNWVGGSLTTVNLSVDRVSTGIFYQHPSEAGLFQQICLFIPCDLAILDKLPHPYLCVAYPAW